MLNEAIKKPLKNLLSYIYPDICVLCRDETPSENYLCAKCLRELEFNLTPNCPLCAAEISGLLNICHQCLEQKRPWHGGGSPLKFQGASREIVHQFKYNGNLTLSRFLIKIMTHYVSQRDFPDIVAVTMVPMHWFKKYRRGFNQAEILAKGIAGNLELPCLELLRREKSTGVQALKTKAQRQKNIKQIFKVREKKKIPDGAILLVDDVMTTGATLTVCSQALLDAGAKKVYVLTAARG